MKIILIIGDHKINPLRGIKDSDNRQWKKTGPRVQRVIEAVELEEEAWGVGRGKKGGG